MKWRGGPDPLEDLEFVKAVLNETMRLYPPVAVTLPRRVPFEEDGVLIAGQPVPAGTTVGVNYYAAFHSPHNFHQPEKFAPLVNQHFASAYPKL